MRNLENDAEGWSKTGHISTQVATMVPKDIVADEGVKWGSQVTS